MSDAASVLSDRLSLPPDRLRFYPEDRPFSDEYASRPGPSEASAQLDVSGRSEWHIDIDRVVYSSAFQRLVGITQIAASEPGAIFHNRLTHSLKVAQFAR